MRFLYSASNAWLFEIQTAHPSIALGKATAQRNELLPVCHTQTMNTQQTERNISASQNCCCRPGPKLTLQNKPNMRKFREKKLHWRVTNTWLLDNNW